MAKKTAIEILRKALKIKSRISPDYSEHTIKLAADEMMVHIDDAIALLEKQPDKPPENILVCKCGWWGSVDQQDALGSECGCCPECGNENLIWLSELQAENERLREALKKYGQHTKECHDEKYPEAWRHCICGLEQALKGENDA